MLTSDRIDLNDYFRQFIKGQHYSMKDADAKILEQKTSRLGWDDGTGIDTYVHLRFRMDGFEPTGTNQLWYSYLWYDDEESCIKGVNCLEDVEIEGQLEPYDYYTLQYFGDYINRDYIMYSYWFLLAQSFFSFIGLPFGMVILIVLNFYMDYCLIYHLVIALFAMSGWYDELQNE